MKKSGSQAQVAGDKKNKLAATKPTIKENPFQYQGPSQTMRAQNETEVQQLFKNEKRKNIQEVYDDFIVTNQDQDSEVSQSDVVQYTQNRNNTSGLAIENHNTSIQPSKSFINDCTVNATNSTHHKNDEKKQYFERTPDKIFKSPLTQFEVIQEDQEDNTSAQRQKCNSDYKRFDQEEDHQNLRLASQKHAEEVKQMIQQFNFHDLYGEKVETKKNQTVQETNYIQKTINSEMYMSILNSKRFMYPESNTSFDEQQQKSQTFNPYFRPNLGQKSMHSSQRQNNLSQDYSKVNETQIIDQANILMLQQHQQMHQQQHSFDSQQWDNQHQKLQDMFLMSNSNLAGLSQGIQTPISMDENKVLNNVIEMEKNYVIMQYEQILQALNVEFQKLLAKNTELEEKIRSKDSFIQTQSLLVQDKEEQLFSAEQQCRMLKDQMTELNQELEFVQQSNKRSIQENEGKQDREVWEQQIFSLKNRINILNEQEMDLRAQIEQQQKSLMQKESQLRQKEEAIFQANRDFDSLQRDYQNLQEVEKALKIEIRNANQFRINIEDQLLEQKQLNLTTQLQTRTKDVEIESLERENRSLKGTLDIIQTNYNEVINENNGLKDQVTQNERQMLIMKGHIEKQDREGMRNQQELKRLQILLEQEQNEKQILQQQFDQVLNSQVTLQRDLLLRTSQQQQQFQPIQVQRIQPQYYPPPKAEFPSSPSTKSIDSYPPPKVQQQEIQYPPPKQVVDKISQQYPPPKDQIKYPPPKGVSLERGKEIYNMTGTEKNSIEPGDHSPQRIPRINKTSMDQTTKILWNGFNPQQNDIQRRRAINQNESQLNEVIYYQQQQNNQQDQALPAAGRRTTVQQSPLEKRSANYEQQVHHLQNSLSALQMDKERIEKDYRRCGTQSKNKQQLEKKQELELEIEIVNKNIQNLKQKLRELNAF